MDEVASVLPASLTIDPQEIPVKRVPVNTPGGLPPLDSKLDELTEHDIATMARHNFTFALPLDYSPPALPKPLGEMIVTVKSAVKLRKKSDAKSAVWVQFLSPPTHAGFKMQLYPRSHEPSRGVGQGHDFSILSSLARSSPRATTFLDLGITELTSEKVTAAASALDDTETLTSDHGAARSPNTPEAPPSIDLQPPPARSVAQTFLDSITSCASKPMLQARRVNEADLHLVANSDDDISPPDGYTRYTPDPSHRGEAMRQRLRSH